MTRRRKLLNPRRRHRPLPNHTVLRCPVNGHQVSWCRGFCRPIEGYGVCGRLAPHAMLDRTQRAILRFRADRAAADAASAAG